MSSNSMAECIANCRDCWQRCTETVHHCLTMGGKHAEANHIALMISCAHMCATSAESMMIGNPQHRETCRACAALCRACAADCRRVGPSDPAMSACADMCDRCADSCEAMARAA